jgi:hypothetical protein
MYHAREVSGHVFVLGVLTLSLCYSFLLSNSVNVYWQDGNYSIFQCTCSSLGEMRIKIQQF